MNFCAIIRQFLHFLPNYSDSEKTIDTEAILKKSSFDLQPLRFTSPLIVQIRVFLAESP